MNKLVQRPVRRRLGPGLPVSRRPLNLAFLNLAAFRLAAPRIFFVVCGAIALFIAASSLFGPGRSKPREAANSQAAPPPNAVAPTAQVSTKPAPSPASNPQAVEPPPVVGVDRPVVASAPPAPSAAPSVAPSAVIATAAPAVNDQNVLANQTSSAPPAKKSETPLTAVARRNLERERKEAERKRARLEKLHQKHLISAEAYQRGVEEYRDAIEKYRSAIKPGSQANN